VSSRVLVNIASNNYLNAIASSVILLGITAALFRLFLIERIAEVAVSMIIVYSGIKIFGQGIAGIMDRISFHQTPQRVYEIKRLASSVSEVRGIEDVRVRRTGDRDLIDLEILLDGSIDLANASYIVEKIRRRILDNLNYVENVLVGFKPTNG